MRGKTWMGGAGALLLLAFGCGGGTSESPENIPATAPEKQQENFFLRPDIVFEADPNPIQMCNRGRLAKTTIRWDAPGVTQIEVRVDSAKGNLMARKSPVGEKETGPWVRDGTRFYLLDAKSGQTLAFITVRFTREGCP